jgi:hypothetical protein
LIHFTHPSGSLRSSVSLRSARYFPTPMSAQAATFLVPAALMRIKSFGLRAKEYWSAVLSRSQCVAGLVADAAGGRIVLRSAGFAFRTDAVYPGSPRLGSADPGLYSAAPLGLVRDGVKGRKMASVGQGSSGRSAGIATRCECGCESDMQRRGVSLRSTPRYRLGWLRHPEMELVFDNDHRSKGYQWAAIVNHQSQGEPPSGN